MFALGVPKSQFRRANDVLTHDLSDPIAYNTERQEDGFFLFSFPDVDEYDFTDIVLTLKNNGVTTIGADEQLTEKKIMKLTDLLKEQGLNRMNRDMTPEEEKLKGPSIIKKVVNLKMDSEVGAPVTVEYDPKKNLTNVTISWTNPDTQTVESHTVDFEAGDEIDNHGNEGSDIETSADSDDGRWQFILDVYVGYQFDMTGDYEEWDFDELIVQSHPDNEDHLDPEDRSDFEDEEVAASIAAANDDIDTMAEGMMCEKCGEIHEGSCGYTQTADGKKLKTPGGTKGVSGLNRTNFMRNQQN